MYVLDYTLIFKSTSFNESMLEPRNQLPPIQRKPPVTPVDFSTESRKHYMLDAGSSKATGKIHVTYVVRQSGANGDIFDESENVSVSFDYPLGRAMRSAEFLVNNRNYQKVNPVLQGQTDIPKDILEVLADSLPLEVRRILPSLQKK